MNNLFPLLLDSCLSIPRYTFFDSHLTPPLPLALFLLLHLSLYIRISALVGVLSYFCFFHFLSIWRHDSSIHRLQRTSALVLVHFMSCPCSFWLFVPLGLDLLVLSLFLVSCLLRLLLLLVLSFSVLICP